MGRKNEMPIQEINYIYERVIYILLGVLACIGSGGFFFIKRYISQSDSHETRISKIEGKCESNHKRDK